ncbi:cupin domain-containing protein [Chitinimonas sp. BJYL2]|uniref:cupin domain-containing protein n=1 Tax=Chitinimonas sp. BJYL2 TaxID=2976696 RepID=UPI0022B5E44B|nr:cupin domain-containing protein [Chitinimonas sp. BJYL2]
MAGIERLDLVAIGADQPVDTDYLLAKLGAGAALLLNQRPQVSYPDERHKVQERIVVLSGSVGLIDEHGSATHASQGQMLLVPAGLGHAYHPASDGVVLVLFADAQ